MELGDWILVIAVVVSLGLGVTSILQTAKIQKRQYRQRLLGEITQWATDILACWFAHGFDGLLNSDVDEDVFFTWHDVGARSQNIEEIASVFGKDLVSTVYQVVRNISAVTTCIQNCRSSQPTTEIPEVYGIEEKAPEDSLLEKLNDLSASTCGLMEKVGKIMSSNMSLG